MLVLDPTFNDGPDGWVQLIPEPLDQVPPQLLLYLVPGAEELRVQVHTHTLVGGQIVPYHTVPKQDFIYVYNFLSKFQYIKYFTIEITRFKVKITPLCNAGTTFKVMIPHCTGFKIMITI